MALSIVAVGDDTLSTANTDFPFAYGFSPVEGNLLIAFITRNGEGTDLEIPTGWTKYVEGQVGGTGTARWAVFYKFAGAAEPNNETFTSETSIKEYVGGIIEISGADTSPVNIFSTNNGTGNSPLALDVTPTVDDCLIISGFSQDLGGSSMSADVSLTQRWSDRSSAASSVGHVSGTLLQAEKASTDNYTHSTNVANEWTSYIFAIQPLSVTTLLNVAFSIENNNLLHDKNLNLVDETINWTMFSGATIIEQGQSVVVDGDATLDIPEGTGLSAGDSVEVWVSSTTTDKLKAYQMTVSSD